MTATPRRTCIGCRTELTQDGLVRLHLDDNDRLRIGRHGPGRGAWLCATTAADCLRTARDRRAVDRAMRRRVDPVSIDTVILVLNGGPHPDTFPDADPG